MDWIELLIVVFGFVGSGYGLYGLVTVKSQQRKAEAEANKVREEVKTNELDNVQEAIKIWREMAESLKAERDEYKQSYLEVQKHNADMAEQLEAIRKELTRLTNINSKMVKLLDKITPENLSEMVDTIKKLHEN
jgi:predicted RNase H-like nuclease (RuvC/YqgF family)